MLTICTLFADCKRNIAFNKKGFSIRGDIGSYPNRDRMLNDLIQNQKLRGLTHKQLVDKIGEPEKNTFGDTSILYYDILTDYGYDIDPVYIITLEFKLIKTV